MRQNPEILNYLSAKTILTYEFQDTDNFGNNSSRKVTFEVVSADAAAIMFRISNGDFALHRVDPRTGLVAGKMCHTVRFVPIELLSKGSKVPLGCKAKSKGEELWLEDSEFVVDSLDNIIVNGRAMFTARLAGMYFESHENVEKSINATYWYSVDSGVLVRFQTLSHDTVSEEWLNSELLDWKGRETRRFNRSRLTNELKAELEGLFVTTAELTQDSISSLIPQLAEDRVESGNKIEERVFISYKTADRWFAEKVFEFLKQSHFKINVSIDLEEIFAGDSLPEQLGRLLQAYDVAIIVMSPDYFSRGGWAKEEAETIIQNRVSTGKRFIPIFLKGSSSEIPSIFAKYRYVDFREYYTSRSNEEFKMKMFEVVEGIFRKRFERS